jgi:hypothetical protein
LRVILKYRQGHFTFDPHTPPPIRRPLAGNFTTLLMNALRSMDEKEVSLSAAKA